MSKKRLFLILIIIIALFGVSAVAIGWYFKGVSTAEKSLEQSGEIAQKKEPQEITVKLYFGNKNMNSGGRDCKAVFPVDRTIPNDLIIRRRAIEEILAGPTAAEAAAGYYSSVPGKAEVISYREKIKTETGEMPYDGDEVKIKSVKILADSAYLDFSKEMTAYGKDACRAETIKAEFNETVKQFPKIGAAVILVEGDDNVLRP